MRIDKYYKIKETNERVSSYEIQKRVKWMSNGEVLTIVCEEIKEFEKEDF